MYEPEYPPLTPALRMALISLIWDPNLMAASLLMLLPQGLSCGSLIHLSGGNGFSPSIAGSSFGRDCHSLRLSFNR
jgi:hypothetical protein